MHNCSWDTISLRSSMGGITLQLMEWNMLIILYRTVPFKNCKSVNGYPHPPQRWYLNSLLVKDNYQATIYCNTSAGQFFSAQSSDSADPISFSYRSNPPNIPGLFNYSLLHQWVIAEYNALQYLVPYGQLSPFQMSLQQSNLSELYLTYFGTSVESPLLTFYIRGISR